ncbi:putative phage terminase large subunit-like protein [Pseudochelatococcus lubricantis]|uniref:Phage terminase large subunit-like protein n=2 Tax=Pseudochelatococcus lubricantis TaxID=1538102 RepID=A0ABX0V718_9HYPH|nr:phage terminase large subunit [Pseudochelatococcus lubricantis]NIJ60254.1 putative phage terminase large subunit-like protein [Pseudochelatococcus lubricantis]
MSFVERCFVTLTPAVAFQDNWHLHAIAHHLDLVRQGKIRRLIINLPPRSLKSIMASVAFPAFVLGHDPARRIICVSYAADLAAKHANDFRAVVEAPWYRRVFPGFALSRLKNTEAEVTTTRHGVRLATSVGGTLTGRGGNLIIIDDPIKPADALSEVRREAVNQWYNNTLLSRLDDKLNGAIVIVMQRVHMDDLVGFVTRQQAEPWTILTLPAIATHDQIIATGAGRSHTYRTGEVLHPAREPEALLDRYRQQLGSDVFSAQYQQEPVPPGGAMIKRAWVLRYDAPPQRASRSQIVQSWDTASKGGAENDWSVCTTWLIENNRFYLLNVHRGRHDYPELKQKALALAAQHKPTKILIEDAGTGTALIDELRRMSGSSIIRVRPERDKQTRMSIQSAKFEAGQVHLPRQAPWLAPFEAELFAFPGSRHDDQIDSVSQALANGISGYTLDGV